MTVVFDIDHEAGNFSEYAASVTDGGRLSVGSIPCMSIRSGTWSMCRRWKN